MKRTINNPKKGMTSEGRHSPRRGRLSAEKVILVGLPDELAVEDYGEESGVKTGNNFDSVTAEKNNFKNHENCQDCEKNCSDHIPVYGIW